MPERPMDARCRFYLRVQVTDEPTYRYSPLDVNSPEHNGTVGLVHPPLIGDLISLPSVGTCRVVDRCWLHASYGSVNWPYIHPHATVGPRLDVIVEQSEGPFVNEAESGEENDDA